MNLMILGGFLGAGKTTFLLKLAHYLADHSESDKQLKLAIIENEIGEVGVDSSILASGGLQTRDLFAGCACCSLRNELIATIRDIEKELNPETILIEATGVAIPNNIREMVSEHLNQEAYVIVLVDGSRWFRILPVVGKLARGQLVGANMVLINKADLLTAEELEQAKAAMGAEAPDATVFAFSAISQKTDDAVLQEICRGLKEIEK